MKVITLSTPHEVFGKIFREIKLRPPTAGDYWRIGPIQEYQPAGDGGVIVVTHQDRILDYARRLFVDGDEASTTVILSSISLSEGLQVEAAVKDFFIESTKLASQRTSSPGEPDKASMLSAA